MSSVASISVCLSAYPLRVLAFESLDLDTSVCYADSSSGYPGQICLSRSSRQGQGHGKKIAYLRILYEL